MVAVPQQTVTRRDGGLGSLLQSNLGRLAVVGIASAGDYTPQVFTSQGDLVAEYTSGPLVDAAAYVLARAGWVLCQRAASSSTGAKGALAIYGGGSATNSIATVAGNTSTAVPAFTGTPDRNYALRLKVMVAGVNLAAVPGFQYSLDGGLTWSATQTAVAGPTAIGSTGLSLGWTDGTFVVSGGVWAGSAVLGAQGGTVTAVVNGNPADAYDVRLELLRDGATLVAATATYRLSLDGGLSWGPETAMPVSGVITPAGTGLTITFTYTTGAGFVDGDVFMFATTAPTYNSGAMSDAYDALDLGDDDFEGVLLTGAYDAALCTSLEAKLLASEAALRYRFAIVGVRDQSPEETRSEWELALRTDFVTWTGLHVVPCAGHASVVSPVSQRQLRRSASLVVAGRAAGVPISEDLAWVERGPLPSVTAIYYDGALHTSLNDFGFTTLMRRKSRTIRGFYIVNPLTGALATSDFKLFQYLRVWNEAARVLVDAMTPNLSRRLLTVPKPLPVPTPAVYLGRTPGAIDDREAEAIEAKVNKMIREVLMEGPVAHVTNVTMRVNRTVDVVATRNFVTSLSLGPLGYAKNISSEIGFALGGA